MIGGILENDCPGIMSHVSVMYSPPRITTIADIFKLIQGLALDQTTIGPDDGKPLDFNNYEKQKKKAKQLVKTRKSVLLIGSSMCAAFSQLQTLNFPKMGKREIEEVIEYGRKHLEFCI